MRERIVVVGAGMVGTRFAQELAEADRDDRFEIDVLGDEGVEPYNRILLTECLARRADVATLALPHPPESVRLHVDAGVTAIDRKRRVVESSAGTFPYDRVVLATGARPIVPPIPGLRPLPRGAYAMRTIHDAREAAATALNAEHAVVIGGGPLGLECAAALRHLGIDVTVLSIADTLLERDLDPPAAQVVASHAADLGLRFVPRAAIERVDCVDGNVSSVIVGGESVAADLLVVACGAEPETALAERAGLRTDLGVVVGSGLRTSDPAVYAVGDCAQTPAGTSGLVAPGWAQARALARALAGLDRTPATVPIEGSGMRLKAVGMDVMTMGMRASQAGGEQRVLTLADPVAYRHVELVVDGDTLAGVTCVGSPELAASLGARFHRAGLLPDDPMHLLLGDAGGMPSTDSSPTTMPLATTVCRCNGVTKGALVEAWERGATSADELVRDTAATTGCGGCASAVSGLADWLAASDGSHGGTDVREPDVAGAKHDVTVVET